MVDVDVRWVDLSHDGVVWVKYGLGLRSWRVGWEGWCCIGVFARFQRITWNEKLMGHGGRVGC